MNIRSLVAVCCLICVGLTPLAAKANGPAKAANACIAAFVDAYLPKDRAVNVRKQLPSQSPYSFHSRRYTLALTARVGSKGETLATARCTADASGQVITLE